MVSELTADQAYKVCGPENVGCDSSQELTALETIVGQDRALRAMQFGLGIKEKGFNIYVSGYAGHRSHHSCPPVPGGSSCHQAGAHGLVLRQ